MKRIAFVSSMENVGGTEKSLLSFLNNLPEKKYSVDLLLMGKPGPLLKDIPKWINVYFIESKDTWQYIEQALKEKRIKDFFMGFFRYFQLRGYWERYKTDTMFYYRHAMHLFQKYDEQYEVVISWFVPNSFETVYTLDCVKAERKILWVHMDVQKDKMPFDAEMIFKAYDQICCVSNACKKSFEEKYPSCSDKTKVFYNFLDIDEIKKLGSVPTEIDGDKRFKLLTCGRLAAEKQPFLAVRIVERLVEDGYRDFVWYFVGDGILKEQLEVLIREKKLDKYVVLLGMKINPYSYISKTDLYVQLSVHESFCLTLAEAQILGIPALSTDFESANEIIKNNVTGKIVKNDEIILYEKIKSMLENCEELDVYKRNLRNYVLESNGCMNDFVEYIDGGCNG